MREVRSCSELPSRAGSRSPRSAGPGSPLIPASAALHQELSLYRPKCSLRGRRAGWGAGISPSEHSRRIALPSLSDPAFCGSEQMANTLRCLSFLSPSLFFLSFFILLVAFLGLISLFCFTSFR